jgi:hypothetical protein
MANGEGYPTKVRLVEVFVVLIFGGLSRFYWDVLSLRISSGPFPKPGQKVPTCVFFEGFRLVRSLDLL